MYIYLLSHDLLLFMAMSRLSLTGVIQQQPSPLSGEMETVEETDSTYPLLWAGRGGRPVNGYTVFSK